MRPKFNDANAHIEFHDARITRISIMSAGIVRVEFKPSACM